MLGDKRTGPDTAESTSERVKVAAPTRATGDVDGATPCAPAIRAKALESSLAPFSPVQGTTSTRQHAVLLSRESRIIWLTSGASRERLAAHRRNAHCRRARTDSPTHLAFATTDRGVPDASMA